MTHDKVEQSLLPVTQADRDAAANMHRWYIGQATHAEELMREGQYDDDDRVQAFALHRIATQEDAEQSGAVAERQSIIDWLLDPTRTGLHDRDLEIAAAIHRGDHVGPSTIQRQEYDGEAVREAAIKLAYAAGALNAATDGQEAIRLERQTVLDRLKDFTAALTDTKADTGEDP